MQMISDIQSVFAISLIETLSFLPATKAIECNAREAASETLSKPDIYTNPLIMYSGITLPHILSNVNLFLRNFKKKL